MNWLDITVLIIVIFFFLIGLSRGLVKQVFSLVSVIAGIAVGLIFYDVLAIILIEYGLVGNISVASVGAFILLSITSFIVIQILGWITNKLIGTLHLSWLNRLGGAVIGSLIGFIIVVCITSLITLFLSKDDPSLKGSIFFPYIEDAYVSARSTIPEDFSEQIQNVRNIIRQEGIKTALKVKDSEILNKALEKEKNK